MKSMCIFSSNKFMVATSIYSFILLSAISIIVDCLSDNQFRNHQELSSDTQDTASNTGDLPSYESSSSPDSKEDSLVPPNELSAIRLNDTSVVLRWEFPEDSQEHLLYFKVQYKPTRKNSVWKTDSQEISSVTRAYQINGLRPGNYFFSVIAVYDNQDNAPSQFFKFKLKAKTKIPPADMPEMKAPEIYWHEAETEYFRFKWHYEPKPSDNEDFGFLVYYRSAHIVSDFTIYNTMDTNVEIAELEPDTPYEAKVVAYNENGISEFSDTITIKTKPPKNELASSSSTIPTISSTIDPQAITTILAQSTTKRPTSPQLSPNEATTQTPSTTQTTNRVQIAPKPHTGSTSINETFSFTESIITFFKPIFSDQGDAMLVVRYLLLILLPVLFITCGMILCIRPYRSKKDPRTPSTDDVQFDLEINGYFKNSFPGVEKEYSTASNGVHTGFVNNHPHINDFA